MTHNQASASPPTTNSSREERTPLAIVAPAIQGRAALVVAAHGAIERFGPMPHAATEGRVLAEILRRTAPPAHP